VDKEVMGFPDDIFEETAGIKHHGVAGHSIMIAIGFAAIALVNGHVAETDG
jgi:hypothetical protein